MTTETELAARFDRILGVLRAMILTETALDPAWEASRKGVRGAFADALFARGKAQMEFLEESPTMDALIINLKDNHYKDPTWPANGSDDAKMLRMVWRFLHDKIAAGKSFAADELSIMSNLCAALERARESLLTSAKVTGQKNYLGIRIDDEHRELRRDGFPRVTASLGPTEWHIVKVAFRVRERGATKAEWMNGYPGDVDGKGPSATKSRIRSKLRCLGLSLADGEGAHIIEIAQKSTEVTDGNVATLPLRAVMRA